MRKFIFEDATVIVKGEIDLKRIEKATIKFLTNVVKERASINETKNKTSVIRKE